MTSTTEVHDTLRESLLVDGYDFVLDLERSQGSRLLDARDGTPYLDMFSFYGSNALGMNHPALVEDAAFRHRLAVVALHKPTSSGVYTTDYADFVATFRRVVGDPRLPHLFFIEGGALAVENALKVAFDWKSRRNEAAGRSAELGSQVMHLSKAFHGRTGYTMSLTNSAPIKVARFPRFDWPRIPVPALAFPYEHELAAVETAEAEALRLARHAFESNAHDVAAFIAEPVQAEGGDNHMRPEFLQAMQALCHEHDALFILDEVQTGCGLTGTPWAYLQLDLQPDIVAFGKKFHVCGIMAGERVDEVADNAFHVSSRLASTWGGNLTDMVRARRMLEVIEADRLFERIAPLGEALLNRLLALQRQHPARVANARGRGLMCAFDLPDPDTRDTVVDRMYRDEHVIILSCGERSIRFRPVLTVTESELMSACDALDRVLHRL
ncbi:MAG: L-lysine 6-transaminase [Ornithinimicrobium sp.]|jgi:L-lysine 6-transaminase|uniref:L-lysine 6-transaminase n=1 Tax=Ornithinimicrobium sp. TaxID=1977084 RepID=UPI003D9BFDB1